MTVNEWLALETPDEEPRGDRLVIEPTGHLTLWSVR